METPEYNFSIPIENAIIGFSLETKRTSKDGEMIQIAVREFLRDSDGELFYACLDQISGLFLRDWMIKESRSESTINNCLIFLYNNVANIYINIPTVMNIIAKRRLESGCAIIKDDIADIRQIDFPGIKMESDCGIIYIFSNGWRRGLYFDLIPIQQSKKQHDPVDLKTLFASLHSYLIFPEVHELDPTIKKQLIKSGWFPFIRILGKPFEKIHQAIKYEFPIVDVSLEVIDTFKDEAIKDMVDAWMNKEILKKHETVIRRGIERFIDGDYISSIHVLFPRIEGIMRYIYLGEKIIPNSNRLVDKLTSVSQGRSENSSLFLPEDFNEYLKQFYFSSFDLETGKIDLSRHSCAHGVAREDDFNKVKAFQAILILDQISFYV